MKVRERAESIHEELIRHRRTMHMHPELGFKEFETSKYIKGELEKMGLSYKEYAQTGITCDIKGEKGEGKTILIRADIDALPLQEDSDVPYRSKVDGVMHACGHDVHIACLLGTARLLKDMKDSFKGTVRLIFQPAEEGPGGAKPMIEEGAIGDLENPDISAAIALHVTAGEGMNVGFIGVKDGYLTAAADEVFVEVIGKGGHGSSPHMAVDPVFVAAQIATQVQGYITRTIDPNEPAVFTIGRIVGGDRHNIISERVRMDATLRTLSREVRAKLKEELPKFFDTIARAYGAEAKTEIITGYDVGINDKELMDIVRESFVENYDSEYLIEVPTPTMGAEDFFEFGLGGKIPTAMFWLGGGNEERGMVNANHSNYFDIDEDCLPIGTTVLAETAIRYLGQD